jgi:hypothetical protein
MHQIQSLENEKIICLFYFYVNLLLLKRIELDRPKKEKKTTELQKIRRRINEEF